MTNAIPFLSWALDLCFKISLSVPFYIIWVGFGIGRKYFSFLPDMYLEPGFWDCVGVFIVVPIIKGVFIPKLAVVSSNSESRAK